MKAAASPLIFILQFIFRLASNNKNKLGNLLNSLNCRWSVGKWVNTREL